MDDATREFLEFYEKHRRESQLTFYRNRLDTYERAHRQAVTLTSLVLFLSSVVSILSAADVQASLGRGIHLHWSVWAAVLPAAATAIAAFSAIYAFQEHAKLYRDADHALTAVRADAPDACEGCPSLPEVSAAEYVRKVEAIFLREQGQWGQ